jgi:hypothetical protein
MPIAAPVTAEVTGPEAEWVDLAWRFDGYSKEDGHHAATDRSAS